MLHLIYKDICYTWYNASATGLIGVPGAKPPENCFMILKVKIKFWLSKTCGHIVFSNVWFFGSEYDAWWRFRGGILFGSHWKFLYDASEGGVPPLMIYKIWKSIVRPFQRRFKRHFWMFLSHFRINWCDWCEILVSHRNPLAQPSLLFWRISSNCQ